MSKPATVRDVLLDHAAAAGAPVALRSRDWDIVATSRGIRYSGAAQLDLPPPSLPGRFQLDNAGIAVTALLAAHIHADPAGLSRAEWPARMQRLHGLLAHILPPDWELWLDGGHNPGAGVVLADHLLGWADKPVHLVIGLNQAKDATEFLRPLLPRAATVWAVREPDQHAALPLEAIISASGGIARPGPDVAGALAEISRQAGPARVLICGSLYLAGEVLKRDGSVR